MTHHLHCTSLFEFEPIPPYDFALTLHKPAGWSLLTPFEDFESDTLWSAARTESGKLIGLKLESHGSREKPKLFCKVFSGKREIEERDEILETMSWMLRVNEDIKQFYNLADQDSLVKALVEDLYGMRETQRPDIFPTLILAVTLQMAPINRSDQMMNLLIKEYGERILFDGREIAYWPSPEAIAKADVRALQRKCKLGYRAKILKDVAKTICAGFPSLRQLEQMSPEEAKAKLMEIKGIGDYSADIVTPHAGFPIDVWSAKIFNLLIFGNEPNSPREIIPRLKKLAEERWGKWRGYVFTYVLNDLDKLSKRFNISLTQL